MNIKICLKVMMSMFALTSYCCATLVDTIARNHDDRRKVYNGDLFIDHKPTNTYTSANNEILSDEHKVDANRSASPDEKKTIAMAVFAAAWTDLTLNLDGSLSPNDMIAERAYKNPYTVDDKGCVVVSKPALRDHYQILYWLDNIARDVVSQIIALPSTIIDVSLLNRLMDYKDLYSFDGFSKATVAGWLNTVRTMHEPGLTDLRLQYLEDQRYLTDWRDYIKFKELTAEICTYVGQPFECDALETNVLPQGEVLHRWIDSIIRTRNKFCGQPCLGKYGMMSRYKESYPQNLMYNHEHHIATIMLIDAMSKLAIADDDFNDAWAGIAEDTPVSEDFIKRILHTLEEDAFGETKPEMWRVKALVRTILQENPALVRLAGDIFSLYAPKMGLKRVYADLMVSGGTYRGWDIFGVDSFAHVINLTEAKNAANPGLETLLRLNFIREIPTAIDTIYSTSIKGQKSAFTQSGHLLIHIKYLFDSCVNRAVRNISIHDYTLSFFYLERRINPNLMHLLEKGYRGTSEEDIRSLYQDSYQDTQEAELYFGLRKGIPSILNKHAIFLKENIKNIETDYPRIIDLYREAYNLGNESAKENLVIVLHQYAHEFTQKSNGVGENLLRSIELQREALALGCKKQESKMSLAITLNNYSFYFITGKKKSEKNYPKAIELLRESLSLGYKLAGRNLVTALNAYAVDFIAEDKTEMNFPKAIELLREAIALEYEPVGGSGYLHPKEYLAGAIYNYAIDYMHGTNGVSKDLLKVIELLREVVVLGYEPAGENYVKKNLTVLLNLLAAGYYNGTNGFEVNNQKAVDLLRESMQLDVTNKDAENNLPMMMNALGADYFNATNGVEKDINKALECFREASRLGYENATGNASKVLFVLGREAFNKAKLLDNDSDKHMRVVNVAEQSIQNSIEMFRESARMAYELALATLKEILNNLGARYDNGENGFEINRLKAVECFRESLGLGFKPAEKNLSIALRNLADDYWKGENGVEEDIELALLYLRESCNLGNEESKTDLPEALLQISSRYNNKPNSVEQDFIRAIELTRESLNLGHLPAKTDLAIYLLNYGVCLNKTKSYFPQIISLCRESLALGNTRATGLLRQALYNYGNDCLVGRNGADENKPKALELYRESADLGFSHARAQLEKLQG